MYLGCRVSEVVVTLEIKGMDKKQVQETILELIEKGIIKIEIKEDE